MLTLCIPATTEAAEIAAAALLRLVCWADPVGGFAATLAPTDEARAIVLGAVVPPAAGADTALAAAMVGNAAADGTDAALVGAAAVGGVGTRVALGLAGSSKVGTGNTGFVAARPVPDGPPDPVFRRGVPPLAPAAALKACSTICCCRARTSLPLVT